MSHHGASVYGCGPAPFTPPPDSRYTMKGDRLYLHVFSWPLRHLHLPGLAGRVEFARFLHDGSEVKREVIEPGQEAFNVRLGGLPAGTLTLEVPVQKPDVLVPVDAAEGRHKKGAIRPETQRQTLSLPAQP